ncbi:hypothetical protein [Streptomyces sp. NBC_00258]|uniref:hypothetical protein n=1 Tax=Streptomyces sp. NBC_00258 TaxID=2903642 RepID=UPI002E2AAAA7|nr:hypothetical protein [Streptomyces sp. NBC_00258]
MDEEPVIIELTHDQAFVLSDWLYRVEESDELSAMVADRAVWSALYKISGTLDKTLVELFMPDYTRRLEQARQRLLDAMGGDGEEASESVSRGPSRDDIND